VRGDRLWRGSGADLLKTNWEVLWSPCAERAA